jgi:hypothetical protein
MYSVVDALRASPAPVDDVRRAECISVALHKLDWARQHRDETASSDALDELKVLGSSWLNSRICGPIMDAHGGS